MEVRCGGRRIFLALAAVAFVFWCLPSSASAANRACPAELNSALKIVFPSTVVTNRRVYGDIELDPNPLFTSWTADQQALVTLGLQGQEPFSEQYWTIEPYLYGFWNNLTWLNRTYEFSVTATFRRGGEACDLKKVKTIRTIRGRNISIKLQKNAWDLNNGAYFYLRCPRVPRSQISTRPIDFWINDRTTVRSLTVRTDCEGSTRASRGSARANNWSFNAVPILDYLELRLKKRRGPFWVGVEAVQGGRKIIDLKFFVKWVSDPARRIYWTEVDAYWNYCINKGRPIKSENGQLYCWTKNRSRNKVRVVRNS